MPLVKKDEQFPERPIVVMLVGTPFSRKTSLASTAKNPVLIDADRGADRAFGRPDTFVLKEGWAELLQEEEAGSFKGYPSIIHDTAKAILDDFLMEYVISKNYKLKTNKMQMYGAIGDEYKAYVNRCRNAGQDLIIIAHDRTKDDDGVNTISPDITGGSKNLLLRICDQVGYVSNKRVQRNGQWVDIVTVNFTPTQETPFCKNVAGLQEIELPHHSNPIWKDFMETHIMQPTKDAISKMSEDQRQAINLLDEWRSAIDAILDDGRDVDAELKAITKDIKERVTAEHIQKQVLAYLVTHYKAIGWKYDGKQTKFLKVDTTAPAVKVETPPAQAAEAEKPAEKAPTPAEVEQQQQSDAIAQAAEERSIESASVASEKPPVINEADQIATQQQQAALATPQINANPHMPPPVNDLFAKRD